MITKEVFQNYVDKGYSMIPISKKIDVEDETPLTIYSRLNKENNSFLLESVEGGIKWAQYSIVGLDCCDSIKVTDNKIEILTNGVSKFIESDDPLKTIKDITSNHTSPSIDDLPRFFGGYVGFFAYESAKYAEDRINKLPS